MNNLLKYILPALIIAACSSHDSLEEDKKHHSLVDKLRHSTHDSIAYEVSTEELMADIKKVLADIPEEQFYILERQSMIKSYPCDNCHDTSLEELQKGSSSDKKAHWDIKMVHADDQTMECSTCHNTDDMNKLKTLTGKMLTFDQSFKNCAQCHSQQHKDWIGGAHGKRVAGWAPPRLIYTCANCHNPHNPAIKPRWPARLNTQKLKELNSE